MPAPAWFAMSALAALQPDTIVALTIPAERTLFDWVSGTLQLVVLVLGAGALVALAVVALALRKSVMALQTTVERLSADAKPLLYQATRAAEDAKALVGTVKAEADRLAGATRTVSDGLQHAAESATRRLDEVNAVLDVLQDEFEGAAIASASTLRGLKVGTRALASGVLRGAFPAAGTGAGGDDEDDDEDDAPPRPRRRRRKRRRPRPDEA